MGVLDALTILGAGIGRGYRGSQEVQRQIAEQKRKALLEEREQTVRETTAKSQQALQEAQIQTEALNRAIGQFGLDVNKKKFEAGQAPIKEDNTPLEVNMFGQKVKLPGNLQTLTDLPDLIKQLSEEKFRHDNPEYYTNYPPAGTAAAQVKLDPRARKIEYLLKAAGVATGGGPNQFEDNEAYSERVAKTYQYILSQLKDADPDAFSAIKRKALSDSTDDDTEEDLNVDPLDQKALAPKKKNRFNVKVKK